MGDWTLFVADLSGGSVMTIDSWGLNIRGDQSSFYWKGATDSMWNTIGTPMSPNWTADPDGMTPILATPSALSDVTFSASGADRTRTPRSGRTSRSAA